MSMYIKYNEFNCLAFITLPSSQTFYRIIIIIINYRILISTLGHFQELPYEVLTTFRILLPVLQNQQDAS